MNFFKKKPNYKPDVNEIQIPLVTITSAGRILFANTLAQNLFEANELENRNITEFIKSDLPSMISGSYNSVRKAFETNTQNPKYVEIISKENHSEHYFILTFFSLLVLFLL